MIKEPPLIWNALILWYAFLSFALSTTIQNLGHHVVYSSYQGQASILAFRFFVQFQQEVTTQEYIKIIFPGQITVPVLNGYPKLRTATYGGDSYSEHGMEFYNLPAGSFTSCISSSSSTNIIYFQVQQYMSTSEVFIIEVVPEPSLTISSIAFISLDQVAMKIISSPTPNNHLTYQQSLSIAMLHLEPEIFPASGFLNINYSTSNIFTLQINSLSSSQFYEILNNNGGYIMIQFIQNTIFSKKIQFTSCSIPGCIISSAQPSKALIPFTGITYQILSGSITYSAPVMTQFEVDACFLSATSPYLEQNYPSSIYKVINRIYAVSTYLIINNLIRGNLYKFKYFWGLEQNGNNERAMYYSDSSIKEVYNQITLEIQFDTLAQINNSSTDEIQVQINLGSSFLVLEGSIITNFSPISSVKPVQCSVSSFILICRQITNLIPSTTYSISLRVIVYDATSFKVNLITIYSCSSEICFQLGLSPIPINFTPKILQNYDTSKFSTNDSWTPNLGDLQVTSVKESATYTVDDIVQRAFNSGVDNNGAGLFTNRGTQAIVLFLSIDPSAICSGACVGVNEILKITLTVNTALLYQSSFDNSGMNLAAQVSGSNTYSFSALPCQGISACYDGQTTDVMDGNGHRMNGKSTDSTQSITKFTIRCGYTQSPSQDLYSCSQMFLGRETILGTFETGKGGVLVIRNTNIAGFSPNILASNTLSTDFLVSVSLEDPFTTTEADQTIVFQSLINAFIVRETSLGSDPVFKVHLVNFSTDSEAVLSPCLLRLRIISPPANSVLLIFLDNALTLSSFESPTSNKYSCTLITGYTTFSTEGDCLGYRGSESLSSTNYLFHNFVAIDATSISSSILYLQVLIPIKPRISSFDPMYLHYAYGTLSNGSNFKGGPSNYLITKLGTISGVSTKGPDLKVPLSPYFLTSASGLESTSGAWKNEYTSQVSDYEFTFTSTTKIVISSTSGTLQFSNLKCDGTNFGGGLIIASQGQDPFRDQTDLFSQAGAFPYQSGKCFKFMYRTISNVINPVTPIDRFYSDVRYAVFCPFDHPGISPDANQITIQKSWTSDTSTPQFLIAQQMTSNTILTIAFSTTEGMNTSIQKIPLSQTTSINTPSYAVTSPPDGFDANVKCSIPFVFRIWNFTYKFMLGTNSLLITVSFPSSFYQFYYTLTPEKVIINESIEAQNAIYNFLGGVLTVNIDSDSVLATTIISVIEVKFSIVRTDFSLATLTLANNYFYMTTDFVSNSYRVLPLQETFYFNSNSIGALKTFYFSPSVNTIVATISGPYFDNENILHARNRMRLSISLASSIQTTYNPDNEQFILELGFLRYQSDSQEYCTFYSDSNYSSINHNIGTFSNSFIFSFKSAFSLSTPIYISCEGISLKDASSVTDYTFQYLNSQSLDMITSVSYVDRKLQGSWILNNPEIGFSITNINLQNDTPTLNVLQITLNHPLLTLGAEYIIYFPREISLSSHMYVNNLPSTTSYLPEKHALRVKIQSIQLKTGNSLTLQIAPISVTHQIKQINPIYIYIEDIDIQTKEVLGISTFDIYTCLQSVSEQFPDPISISSASLNPHIQQTSNTLNVSFYATQNLLGPSTDVFFFVYSRIGSQTLQNEVDYSPTPSSSNQSFNGFQRYHHTMNTAVGEQITLNLNYFACHANDQPDIFYVPVEIAVVVNNVIIATTYQKITNMIAVLKYDSNTYTDEQFFVPIDSEGDQLHAIDVIEGFYDLQNLATVTYQELQSKPLSISYPLINLSQFPTIQANSDLFSFIPKGVSTFTSQILTIATPYQYLSGPNPDYINVLGIKLVKTSQPCIVYSEFSTYNIRVDELKVHIRFYPNDYCRMIDSNLYLQGVALTPTISSPILTFESNLYSNPSTIYETWFQVIVSAATGVTSGQTATISYVLNGTTAIVFAPTQIQIIGANSLAQDLTSIRIEGTSFNYATLTIKCIQNSAIYYELDISNRQITSELGFPENQTNFAGYRSIPINLTRDKQSTHQIGSFVCRAGEDNYQYNITGLRSFTNYTIRFEIADTGTNWKSNTAYFTTQFASQKLAYIQLFMQFDETMMNDSSIYPQQLARFLCFQSYQIHVPHRFLRFTQYPNISCQDYLDTNPTFISNRAGGGSSVGVCQYVLALDSYINQNGQLKTGPRTVKNDQSIIVEMDFESSSDDRVTLLTDLKNDRYLNVDRISDFDFYPQIAACPSAYALKFSENIGNLMEPMIIQFSNTCTDDYVCTLKLYQLNGGSILYLIVSKIEIPDYKTTMNVEIFKNQVETSYKSFIYPIDKSEIAEFKIQIDQAETNFYVYYFATDLTISDYAYVYPSTYNSAILYYVKLYDASIIIFTIVAPILGLAMIVGIFYGFKYWRSKSKIKPNEVDQEQTPAESLERDEEQKRNIFDSSNGLKVKNLNRNQIKQFYHGNLDDVEEVIEM